MPQRGQVYLRGAKHTCLSVSVSSATDKPKTLPTHVDVKPQTEQYRRGASNRGGPCSARR